MTMKLTLALMMSLTLAGCNTIQGIGKDMSKLGEGISNTAGKIQYKRNEAKQQQLQEEYIQIQQQLHQQQQLPQIQQQQQVEPQQQYPY